MKKRESEWRETKTRFYQKTALHHDRLMADALTLRGSPWFGDEQMFISEMGLKRNNKWFLDRHDPNKPHCMNNSFWNKSLEAISVYSSGKAGKWSVMIALEFDSLRSEPEQRQKMIRIATADTRPEALNIYEVAKALKDEGEWLEWSPTDWKLAVSKRINDQVWPLGEDHPIHSISKWKQSPTRLSYPEWVTTKLVHNTPSSNKQEITPS